MHLDQRFRQNKLFSFGPLVIIAPLLFVSDIHFRNNLINSDSPIILDMLIYLLNYNLFYNQWTVWKGPMTCKKLTFQ
jgi:hypothetical protein